MAIVWHFCDASGHEESHLEHPRALKYFLFFVPMSSTQKSMDIPNEFKTQADSMFKELNGLIDDVNVKLNHISKSIGELEAKLTIAIDENKQK